MQNTFGISPLVTGVISATIVGLVIVGGITRIGAVTGILSPFMAAFYVAASLIVIVLNIGAVPGTFALILREAFNPTAGVAGTGIGAILVTMMWGVRRGLFSNEAARARRRSPTRPRRPTSRFPKAWWRCSSRSSTRS